MTNRPIRRIASAAMAAAACLASAITAPLAASPSQASAERLLAAHNRERERVGVPRLAWSERLAAQAQDWADQLARTNRFQHASDRAGAGENLWRGTAGRYSAEAMIGSFLDEGRHFRAGAFPNVSRTGRWRNVGHYSQVIWRGTQEVGCATARSGGGEDILVCRYYPAGNVLGYQVL
jgi:hypothetical protein